MTEPTILQRIIDSNDRGVGGGSAAALAGSMAAGLAGLVARLSDSGEFGLGAARCHALADEVDGLASALRAGAEADADAYRRVVEAYRLPRDGAEATAARAVASQAAMVGAATAPRDNARAARRVREICAELEGSSNPNASSDLAVAVLLAEAALLGCVYNIEINIPLITDEGVAAELQREADDLRGFVLGWVRRSPTEEEQ